MVWKGGNITNTASEMPRANLTSIGTSNSAGQIYEEIQLNQAGSAGTGTIDVAYGTYDIYWTTGTIIDPLEDKLLIGFAGKSADAITSGSGEGQISWKAWIGQP